MLWLLTCFTVFASVFADVQSLVWDIGNLTESITEMDTLVKNFKHGIFSDIKPIIKLQNAAVNLGAEIEQVTKDFNSSARLTGAETLKIATPFTKMIPPLQEVLTDIGNAKPEFDKAILDFLPISCVIKGHLVHLKKISDSLIDQVKITIFQPFAGVVTPLAVKVDAAFEEQLNGTYSKTPTLYLPIKL